MPTRRWRPCRPRKATTPMVARVTLPHAASWPRRWLESHRRRPHADAMSTLVSLPGATPAAAPDYQSLERPLNFTESAAAKVKSLIQEERSEEHTSELQSQSN